MYFITILQESVFVVNTSVDDGSVIVDLMKCFIMKDVDNPRFPRLSAEVTALKTTEEGVSVDEFKMML